MAGNTLISLLLFSFHALFCMLLPFFSLSLQFQPTLPPCYNFSVITKRKAQPPNKSTHLLFLLQWGYCAEYKLARRKVINWAIVWFPALFPQNKHSALVKCERQNIEGLGPSLPTRCPDVYRLLYQILSHLLFFWLHIIFLSSWCSSLNDTEGEGELLPCQKPFFSRECSIHDDMEYLELDSLCLSYWSCFILHENIY